MSPLVLVPIVEGHGELTAVPALIRGWLRHRNYHAQVHVDGPIRAAGKGAIKAPHNEESELGVEHYIEYALLRDPAPDAIVVFLDADDDCPKDLGPALLARARRVVPKGFPIGVVVANREFEAWFLAAFPSARFRDALTAAHFNLTRKSLPKGFHVEGVRDCKRHIATLLGLAKFEETIHQEAIARLLPFTTAMAGRSRSFRKLLSELHSLLIQARKRRTY
jgi:Domain of unknown function (DUF4276)